MNITHIDVPDDFEWPEDMLADIFDKQRELANRYAEIEGHSPWPVKDIDERPAQVYLKDFAWRCVEELAEMAHAEQHSVTEEHGFEELGDALHFLTELCLICEYKSSDILPQVSSMAFEYPMEWIFNEAAAEGHVPLDRFEAEDRMKQRETAWLFVQELGWLCNHLKNKAWKQTDVPTDKVSFFAQLRIVWIKFAAVSISRGVMAKELYLLYYKKELVNRWRQETEY